MKLRYCGFVFAFAAMSLMALMTASHASTERYACKTVRIVVPYAAGGPSDTGARLVASSMSDILGASVIVENRGGAGGLIGTEQVAQAPADGCTILLGAVGPLVYIPSERKVAYNVQSDFIPLGLIWQSPLLLVVNPKLGIKAVSEFVEYAKAGKDRISVASAGLGTNTHMASELLKREADISLLHVPYKGTGAALPDLLSGQVSATISDVATMASMVRDGRLVGLAVTAHERSPLLPDVPAMSEVGLSGARTENWYGLLVKAGTPPDLVARLKDALQKAVTARNFQDSLAIHGATVRDVGPEAFSALISAETKRWLPIIRENGIKF